MRFEDMMEALVLDALCAGARTMDEIYPYVYMRDDRANRPAVEKALGEVFMNSVDMTPGSLYN